MNYPGSQPAKRYQPPKPLIVASKTIGTQVVFNLAAANASASGLLLTWNTKWPIPFSENTILEMTIDPVGSYLKNPVKCLGKIVRKEGTKRPNSGIIAFGVRIIQMDIEESDKWDIVVEALSQPSVQEAANTYAAA